MKLMMLKFLMKMTLKRKLFERCALVFQQFSRWRMKKKCYWRISSAGMMGRSIRFPEVWQSSLVYMHTRHSTVCRLIKKFVRHRTRFVFDLIVLSIISVVDSASDELSQTYK